LVWGAELWWAKESSFRRARSDWGLTIFLKSEGSPLDAELLASGCAPLPLGSWAHGAELVGSGIREEGGWQQCVAVSVDKVGMRMVKLNVGPTCKIRDNSVW